MAYLIEVQNQQKSIPVNESAIENMAQNIFAYMKVKEANLSVLIVTNKVIHGINRRFLAHDYPTDVIAFDLTAKELSRSQKKIQQVDGEIIISAVMAQLNAKRFQTSAQEELRLYLAHGILHLLGYDDHGVEAKKRMRAKEQELLKV